MTRKQAVQKYRSSLITRLQSDILKSEHSLPLDACPVTHHFAPGIYCREIHIPAGVCIVGARHRHSHPNTISKGAVQVFTEQEGLVEYYAPCTFISVAGVKRVILALEDTVWTTYHSTHSTDLNEIEREVIISEST